MRRRRNEGQEGRREGKKEREGTEERRKRRDQVVVHSTSWREREREIDRSIDRSVGRMGNSCFDGQRFHTNR